MMIAEIYFQELITNLEKISTPEKANSSQRYFPKGIHCIGANASDIKLIIINFHKKYSNLNADDVLNL